MGSGTKKGISKKWVHVISENGAVVDGLQLFGLKDERSMTKQVWNQKSQNALLITGNNVTLTNFKIRGYHVGIEVRGDNVTLENGLLEFLSGDAIQGNGLNFNIQNITLRHMLDTYPYEVYHSDIFQWRSNPLKSQLRNIKLRPSYHPWARKEYQGILFTDDKFTEVSVSDIDLPESHKSHGVTFAQAENCKVENVSGGGSVWFRNLQGGDSVGCEAYRIEGGVLGACFTDQNPKSETRFNEKCKHPTLAKNAKGKGMKQVNFDNSLVTETAERLNIEPELIMAVCEKEASKKPFYNEFPSLLFERHVFARVLARRGIDATNAVSENPELSQLISYRGFGKGGYGSFANQIKRFQMASTISFESAIEACSWGAFQVLGENFEKLGFDSPQQVYDLAQTVEGQFQLFILFMEKTDGVIDALRTRNWQKFAKLYNGGGDPDYAPELAQVYRRILARQAPKKIIRKGSSRTVNSQIIDVTVKTTASVGTGAVAMGYGIEDIPKLVDAVQTGVEKIKGVKDQVDELNETVTKMGVDVQSLQQASDVNNLLLIAIVGMLLVLLIPNFRALYAYLNDNGFIKGKNNFPL